MNVETDRLVDLIHELMGKIYKDTRTGIWRIEDFDSDQKATIWNTLMAIARSTQNSEETK